MEEVDISYYDLKGHDLHMSLAPGDLIKICNVLHDYTDLLVTLTELNGDDIDKRFTNAFYTEYVKSLKKIQEKIETAMRYSTEHAIEKCRKKQRKKAEDIGEDALVLATRVRAEKAAANDAKAEPKDNDGQMSLFK